MPLRNRIAIDSKLLGIAQFCQKEEEEIPIVLIDLIEHEGSSTLKKALTMQGPVLVSVPVDYRDNHRLMEIVHPEALN
jgi:hypothetical protein